MKEKPDFSGYDKYTLRFACANWVSDLKQGLKKKHDDGLNATRVERIAELENLIGRLS